jgi:hypothetical protein
MITNSKVHVIHIDGHTTFTSKHSFMNRKYLLFNPVRIATFVRKVPAGMQVARQTTITNYFLGILQSFQLNAVTPP